MKLMLDDFAKLQTEWERMARAIGCPNESVPDAVQELYLRLGEIEQREGDLDRISDKGSPNRSYCYAIIRSVVMQGYRDDSKIPACDIERIGEIADETEPYVDDARIEKAKRALDELHWYDRRIFELHLSGYTIRKLSAETGISTSSIFNTLKNVKRYIRSEAKGPKA